jgi:hypothetical protein
MTDSLPEQPAIDSTVNQAETTPPPEKPHITFMGNSYDLTALGAMSSGILAVFLCLSCNMGLYVLPLLPLVLGVIGLLGARHANDPKRSRLWSWIGVASAIVMILMITVFMVAYIAFIIFMMFAARSGR